MVIFSTSPVTKPSIHPPTQQAGKVHYCQSPVRLGVDFVLPLSQEQQEPPTKIYQMGVY